MESNSTVKPQTIEWLKSAYGDLQNIKYILHDEFLTHIVAFHAQQAVEKTLKALIENKTNQVPKIHKLQNLIGKIDTILEFEERILETLDELYTDSRYPGDMGLLPHGKPTLNDAKEFYIFAQNIFDNVRLRLNIGINEILN